MNMSVHRYIRSRCLMHMKVSYSHSHTEVKPFQSKGRNIKMFLSFQFVVLKICVWQIISLYNFIWGALIETAYYTRTH